VAGLELGLALAACATSLSAHDVWLEPSSFAPRAGEVVKVHVLVGEGFRGESVPRWPSRFFDFWIGDSAQRKPVLGVTGVSPAGVVRVSRDAAGWRIVHYASRPKSIELSPERFAQHLASEGLEQALQLHLRTASGAPVREVYSRCASALIAVAGEPDELPPAPDDCALTLWPLETDPGAATDRAVEFEVRKNGAPIEGALVRALRRDDPERVLEARTDARGRAVFPALEPGRWLVKTLHMERVPDTPADWRSWWASLTFERLKG